VHGREGLKADLRGISILVGMSGTIVSMALEQILRSHGYTATAKGGRPAERFVPDLLITDMGSTKPMGALNCARNIDGVLSCGASKSLFLKAIEQVSAGKVFMDEHLVRSGQVLTGRGRLPSLTTRQREVIRLVGQGLTDRAIGEQLGVSFCTVKTHLRIIREKLGLTRRVDLIKLGSNFTPEK
jgi:DNA-binding CsgD family transcriptional regulator